MLLAIDPGVNSGWAVFDDSNKLIDCRLAAVSRPPALGLSFIGKLVIEHPMIYPHGKTPNPNSIVSLAFNAGEWAGVYKNDVTEIQCFYPREWKGTIKPDVCNERTWASLSPAEQAIVDRSCAGVAPSKRHNVLDAIGLGLFACGRVGTGVTRR